MSCETLDSQSPSLSFQAAVQIGREGRPTRGGVHERLAQHDQFGGVENGQGDAATQVQIV
jgi:hypothetical protein